MEEVIKYFEQLEARIATLEAEKQAAETRITALEEEKEKYQRILATLGADVEELKNRPYVELDEEFEEEEEEAVDKIVEVEKPVEITKEEPLPELPIEEPIIAEPIVEEPVAKEPAVEKPAVEEKASPKAAIYGKAVDDIRLAISLGDRFLYQRELFGQNAELMQRTLTDLNGLSSFDEALAYVNSHFQWDTESNTYQQFLVTLHRRFG